MERFKTSSSKELDENGALIPDSSEIDLEKL